MDRANLLKTQIEEFEVFFMKELIGADLMDFLRRSKSWITCTDIEHKLDLIKEDAVSASFWATYLEEKVIDGMNEKNI